MIMYRLNKHKMTQRNHRQTSNTQHAKAHSL